MYVWVGGNNGNDDDDDVRRGLILHIIGYIAGPWTLNILSSHVLLCEHYIRQDDDWAREWLSSFVAIAVMVRLYGVYMLEAHLVSSLWKVSVRMYQSMWTQFRSWTCTHRKRPSSGHYMASELTFVLAFSLLFLFLNIDSASLYN